VSHTFEDAAAKYVDEATHKSIERDIGALARVMPFLSRLDLSEIHDEALKPVIDAMRAGDDPYRKPLTAGGAVRELAAVRRILTLAARKWRDESGNTWLPAAPLLTMPSWSKPRAPMPLDWSDQRAVLKQIPAHLVEAAIYAVNTGLRDATQAALRWEWEVDIPEIGASVFVVPARAMKGEREDHVVVHNEAASRVIEACRGRHPDRVFTYEGKPVASFANSAWEKGRARAGFPGLWWHDWRHTFARRLRAARVPLETRKVLLAHANGDITTHYSGAELQELIDAVRKLDSLERRGSGVLLKAVK